MAITFHFNAADGTLLKDHVENGYGFSNVPAWEITNNGITNDYSVAGDAIIQMAGASFSDPANVSFDITFNKGTTGNTGILIGDGTANNGYLIRCNAGDSEIEVWSITAGSYAVRIQKAFVGNDVTVTASVVSGVLTISSSSFTDGTYALPGGLQQSNIFFRCNIASSNTYITSLTVPIPDLGALSIANIGGDNSVQRGETVDIQLADYGKVLTVDTADIDGTPLTGLSWDGVTGILTGTVSGSQSLTTTGVLTVTGTESS